MQSLAESIESARKRTKCWIVLRLWVVYGMKGIHCFCLGYTSEILFQHGTPGVIQMRLQSANINWELLEWDLWLLWPWHPSTWLIHGSNEKGAAFERVLIVQLMRLQKLKNGNWNEDFENLQGNCDTNQTSQKTAPCTKPHTLVRC